MEKQKNKKDQDMKGSIKANRNSVREERLRAEGVKFSFVPEVEIKRIKKHPTNVRIDENLNLTNVKSILYSLRNGAGMEPVIISENGDGFDGIDCHHRLAAAEEYGADHVPALVVRDVSDAQIARLQRKCNIWNGYGTERSRVELAVALLAADETVDSAKAAEEFGVTVGAVRDRLRAARVRAELQDKGHDLRRKPLKDGQLSALSRIEKRTGALLPAAALAADARMTEGETRALATELANAPDDAALHELLARKSSLLQERLKTKSPPKMTLAAKIGRNAAAIRNMASMKGFEKGLAKQLAPSARTALKDELVATKKVLDACIKVLG